MTDKSQDVDPATEAFLGHRNLLFTAAYELLGWIITSLLILTISGVLRRDLER